MCSKEYVRGLTRGLLWFWIHCKHLFCTKSINSAQNGPTELWFNDESSFFTVLWGPFSAQGMFFEWNKCLQWIQNHLKPLIWPLKCYLKHIYFGVFWCCIVKSMGHKLSSVITHRKLPLLQCYHIFSSTRGVYLPKNHYENYSAQMVPTIPVAYRLIL